MSHIAALQIGFISAIYNAYIANKRHTMTTGSIFENNRTQAVRLPAETRFPGNVKKVLVRVLGRERILTPVDHMWDSFFLSDEGVSEDFMEERPSQEQEERESF